MKNYFALFTLLFLFALPLTSLAQDGKKNEKAVIKTEIFCDHCQECPSCGKSLKNELLKITGVKMFEIDQTNNTFTVYFDGRKTNLKTIKSTISKLGYAADEIPADATAYANLDGCCKKA